MSRGTHVVIQCLLLVLWAFVLMADNVRSVSSQSCSNPPYFWTIPNPYRNFWNANIGNVTVEMDQMFATQYPSVPDAAARIEAGHGMDRIYVPPMLTLLASVNDRLRKLRKRVGRRTEGFTG
jgi:hypothetical protein